MRAATLAGVGLLERAVGYLLGSLHLVTPDALSHATPCRDWDLRDLLHHVDDSLLALHESAGGQVGSVALRLPPADGELVAIVRQRARRLVGAWAAAPQPRLVAVDGLPITAAVAASVGAVEIAVHGWDVAQACGHHRVIPPELAGELLELTPLFVDTADRGRRFADPVWLPYGSSISDRLVAYVGRNPHCALANRTASWLLRAS
ncbi:MAG: TIGR03086 family protein [Streptosporangiales bacterium]|nr:TIGR03086 family protein [Streptosporangiales bacterium]